MGRLILLDYVFLAIGIFGILYCLYHYFFTKPKSVKRQHELDKLYSEEINKIVKAIKGDN